MSKNKSLFILGIAAYLACSGCSVEVGDAEAEKPAPTATMAATRQNPEYKLIGQKNPYEYKIEFRPDIAARLSDVRFGNLKVQATSINILYSGYDYEFRLMQTIEAAERTLTVQTPKDIEWDGLTDSSVVSADNEIWEIVTDGRLFLTRNALLINGDKPLLIQAKEIISDGATIRNFDPDVKAAEGRPGRDGGPVNIKSERLTGTLNIHLKGETGGKGASGEKYDTHGYDGASYTQSLFDSSPRPGGSGGDGRQGRIGGRGGRGGNAGNLFLEIADTQEAEIKISNEPGHFGEGGDGGPGEPGGRGGLPGINLIPGTGPQTDHDKKNHIQRDGIAYTYECRFIPSTGRDASRTLSCDSTRGADGNIGEPGPQGPRGEDGSIGKVCRIVDNKARCN